MVNENEVVTIKLDDIIPNRFQPREVFDEQSMQELADSIKLHGVIQPIIVRPVDNKYEIIAGERRYKASVMAGKVDIPALVRNKDDKDSSIIAFIENSQRKNVSPIEEAKTCERLLTNNDMTQEQLAKQLGMSQSTLANKLRLLTLPVEIQDALLHGEISERHARTLLSIKDTKAQLDLLEKIRNEKMTVRELEGVIKGMMEEPNKDGLYNLPGSEDAQAAIQNESTDGMMDFSRYETEGTTSAPQEAPAAPAHQNQFLDFINTLDTTSIAAEAEKTVSTPTTEVSQQSQENNDFMSFMNNFESSAPATPAPQEAPTQTPEAPATPKEDNQFLSFLNNFDDSKVASETLNNHAPSVSQEQPQEAPAPTAPAAQTEDEKFDAFLSNFNTGPVESTPVENVPATPTPTPEAQVASQEASTNETNNDFMAFLNQFDDSKVTPPEMPEAPVEENEQSSSNNDFMAFLNQFDDSKVKPVEAAPQETSAPTPETPAAPAVQEQPQPANNGVDQGFVDFLSKYEAPVQEPVDLGPVNELKPEPTTVNESANIAETMDVNAKYLNPIEEVAPKVEYVENSPNYVDVTKPISYDSVDSIIGKLKVVTDEIKKSKYKITTEETDFDDVYTITIKIDKRNFL